MKVRPVTVVALATMANFALAPLGIAGTWSAPATVATIPYNDSTGYGTPYIDIDGNGNAVAAWVPGTGLANVPPNIAQAASARFFGPWTAPVNLSFPGTVTGVTLLMSSESGFSNILLSTSAGLVSSDDTASGAWTPGVLIGSNLVSARAYANRAGDRMVVALSGTAPPRGNVTLAVTATFRHGSTGWQATETVATGNNAAIETATVAPNGTAIIAWNTSTRVCARYCVTKNLVRHISTRAPGNSPWVEISGLPAPLNDDTNNLLGLVADASGNQVFLVYRKSDGSGQAIVRRNGAWSSAATAIPGSVLAGGGAWPQLHLDGAGNATIVVSTTGAPRNANIPGNESIGVIDGNLAANSWSPVQIVSALDVTALFAFAENSAGAAVIGYASNWNTQLPYSIHAVTRAATGGAWSAPKNLDSSLAYYYFGGVVVDESGQAALIYAGDDAALTFETIRAFEYKP